MIALRQWRQLEPLLLISTLLSITYGQDTGLGGWMIYPPTRSRADVTLQGCRAPQCPGPCDGPIPLNVTRLRVARGELLQIVWPRNSHPGGFIRLSMVPSDQSDQSQAFDNAARRVVCAESECLPQDVSNTTSPDQTDAALCRTTFVVPQNIPNGPVTLQWLYWGGGLDLAQYYSCSDLTIGGGTALVTQDPVLEFRGGDAKYPGENQCRYFNSGRLGDCILQPCSNAVGFVGSGQEFAGSPTLGVPIVTVSFPPLATTATPTPTRSTPSIPFGSHISTLASSVAATAVPTRSSTDNSRVGEDIKQNPQFFVLGLFIPLILAFFCAVLPCIVCHFREQKQRIRLDERQASHSRQTKFPMAASPLKIQFGGNVETAPTVERSSFLGRDSHEMIDARVVTALYDFQGRNEGEMNFSKGDKIVLREMYSDGWGMGHLVNQPSDDLKALPLNYLQL